MSSSSKENKTVKKRQKSFKATSAKEKRNKCAPRRIPATVLQKTLKLIKNPSDPIWSGYNTSCVPVTQESNIRESSMCSEITLKLKLARECVLRRDWTNLAKILTSNCFNVTHDHVSCYYPTFVKYATILLMHNDETRLDIFLKTMLACRDPDQLMELCTTYPWTRETGNEE